MTIFDYKSLQIYNNYQSILIYINLFNQVQV